MIRAVATAAALVVFMVPLLATPTLPIAVPGGIALILAVAGIVVSWRWPVTAAACVFVIDYAAALLLAGPSVSVVGAALFGLALLILLQSADLARAARHAVVDPAVLRSQAIGWAAFGAATVCTAAVVMVFARAVAGAIPLTAAPLLAAASALGVILALGTALTRAAGRREP